MKKLLTTLLFSLLLTEVSYAQDPQSLETYQRYQTLANNAFERDAIDSALYWAQRASDYAKVNFGESHPYYATSLDNLANCYDSIGDYTQAIELHQQALEIQREVLGDSHPDYALSLMGLALCYNSIGDYTQAIELCQQALEITRGALGESHPAYALSLHNLALCYNSIGDYTQAIELCQQAIEIQRDVLGESHPDYALSLNNLASYYNSIGDYTQAIELHQQVLEIRREVLGDRHPDYATSLNNLASYYNSIGDYTQAIELCQQAIEILRDVLGESHPYYATSLGSLAICYDSIGDYTQAIELCQQALEIRREVLGDRHPDYATSLNNLALCYNSIGDYTQAIELCQQAIEILRDVLGESHPYYATSLHNLALCYYSIGDYTQAIELHQQAIEIQRDVLGDSHPDYALSLYNLALYYNSIGDYIQAIELHQQALEIRREVLGVSHPHCTHSIGNLCFTYYHAGQYSSIPQLWGSLHSSLRESTISQFRDMTSFQRQIYWNNTIMPSVVFANNKFAMALADDKQSMEVSYNSLLLSKGIILTSDIEFDRVIRESGNMELLAKFEELRTTRAILNTYYNKPIAERPTDEVERLEARAQVLEADLIAGSKEYADFTRYLGIEWQDVKSVLGANDVAIEIMSADEGVPEDIEPYIAALILRKDWDAPIFVKLCKISELECYFTIGHSAYATDSVEFYNLIWSKLEPYINEGDDVFFAPDGLLYQMNIEVLQDANGRRANEKWNLCRVSSTRELCMLRPENDLNSAVLYGGLTYSMDDEELLAASSAYNCEDGRIATRGFIADSTMRNGWNYLPGTQTEVEAIAQMCESFNIRAEIYSGTFGNEESFKALSGREIPIIHLATHGFFYRNEEVESDGLPFFHTLDFGSMPQRPDNSLKRSGLILSGGDRAWRGEAIPDSVDDGILLAEEIAAMDLTGTELVVLSACETGLGEITSEGVFGLQRAFKKAGVQTIIMSLWAVEDNATSLFMQTFYSEWFSGKTKHDAFKVAQETVRAEYPDACYWASFIMLD